MQDGLLLQYILAAGSRSILFSKKPTTISLQA